MTLPAIIYLWVSGDYGNVEAALYSVLLGVSGLADNALLIVTIALLQAQGEAGWWEKWSRIW